MRSFVYIFLVFINASIEIITLLMFIRAILSWFPVIDRSSKIMSFIYMVTEAVISPVRRLLERFPSLSSFPLDVSFLVTYLLLHAVQFAVTSMLRML